MLMQFQLCSATFLYCKAHIQSLAFPAPSQRNGSGRGTAEGTPEADIDVDVGDGG